MTAAIRPDDWNLPLFLHILGAMILVGAVALAFVYLLAAWRGRASTAYRAGFRALLYGAVPGYLLMRVAGQWIYSKEGLDELDPEPSWIGIGFSVADAGLLLLLIATAVSGVASRRAAKTELGEDPPDDLAGTGGIRLTTIIVGLLLVAYLVVIWAMTTKPV
jgi:uncharacterized membrane protein